MSAEQTHVMGSGIIGNSLANIFNRNLSYTTNFSLIKIEGKLIKDKDPRNFLAYFFFSYFNEIGNFDNDEYYNNSNMMTFTCSIFSFLFSSLKLDYVRNTIEREGEKVEVKICKTRFERNFKNSSRLNLSKWKIYLFFN